MGISMRRLAPNRHITSFGWKEMQVGEIQESVITNT